MRRAAVLWSLLVCVAGLSAVDAGWLYGRIGDVRKSVNSRAKAWVVNTPITEDETIYTISVHFQDKLFVGTYQPVAEESPPPSEWTANYPVKVLLQRDTMTLRSPTGDVQLRIVQRKNSRPMMPLTTEEKKALEQVESPARSMIGFSEDSNPPANKGASAPAEAAAPAPPANLGTVMVRSVPYLSEVFVDGESMGYTPAKINVAQGKHAFRVEKPGYKPWTKEITVTTGSELTLDASLERK